MRNDLTIYDDHAREWWEPRSRWFRSLRSINRFRLALLDQWLGTTLSGATVVDLGCGGGFLAEPLAQRGARVIGCDLSAGSVASARDHARSVAVCDGAAAPRRGPLPVYLRADARRAPLRDGCADLVLLADLLEHLEEPQAAVQEGARLLRAGGHLYVNTLNRTWRARLLAVTLAEGLRLVPRGTHDPRLFITPDELTAWARACGLERVEVAGEIPRIALTLRTWTVHLRGSRDISTAYSALFRRPPA